MVSHCVLIYMRIVITELERIEVSQGENIKLSKLLFDYHLILAAIL